jgi:hypothetical protein
MRSLLVAALCVLAVPASAGPPIELPFEFVFDEVNPCSGDIHTVVITVIQIPNRSKGA